MSRISNALEQSVGDNVKAAYKHIFKTARISLFANAETRKFDIDFTDENYEFRKTFKIKDIELLIDEGNQADADLAVAQLEALIKRIKANAKTKVVSGGLSDG